MAVCVGEIMRKARYNIQLPNGVIKKFNVYMNDACTRFIYFEGKYVPVVRLKPYKGGWLWKIREERK
jgi:hypothetical protein